MSIPLSFRIESNKEIQRSKKQKRKRLRDRQKPPRDRQRASVTAMSIQGSFPLCPCDDYSQELSLVVIAVQSGGASTEIK
jgi:hypothetical protein